MANDPSPIDRSLKTTEDKSLDGVVDPTGSPSREDSVSPNNSVSVENSTAPKETAPSKGNLSQEELPSPEECASPEELASPEKLESPEEPASPEELASQEKTPLEESAPPEESVTPEEDTSSPGNASPVNDPNDDDEFGDFDEWASGDGDDNDDFDFNDTTNIPPTPAEEYVRILQEQPEATADYVRQYFDTHWHASAPDDAAHYTTDHPLCTPCSSKLWDKLSRDSVFYNPITGAVGQFQWTRSETNRAYLNALGVTINYDHRLGDGRSNGASLRSQSSALESSPSESIESSTDFVKASSPARAMSADEQRASHHTRSNSLSGVVLSTHPRQGQDAPHVEEEPELDIDIAKAYCELTEETIRVFPNVKLNSMVDELSRLQRQAAAYIGYLLDQREQLLMDAETYNDIISCIVSQAQRLREHSAAKDSSPAMVTKKKKTGGFLRRKQNSTQLPTRNSASMGGGVVGVQTQNANTSTQAPPGFTTQSRRSM